MPYPGVPPLSPEVEADAEVETVTGVNALPGRTSIITLPLRKPVFKRHEKRFVGTNYPKILIKEVFSPFFGLFIVCSYLQAYFLQIL